MRRPPLVISIQSQVVMGHVGNSAAVFPMQAAGLEVAQIPTVLFSNTPFYPTLRGCALPPEIFADLLLGAEERGLPERAAFLVTGYIGSIEVARQTAAFVRRAKAANPRLIYLCDPVMGDTGPGLYVPSEIASVIRNDLLPLADIATPNPFELSWLTDSDPVATLADIPRVGAGLGLAQGAHLVATGCALAETAEGMIETVVLGPEGLTRHPVRKLPIAISGTGDLFSGLIVAGISSGLTLSAAVDAAQVQMSRAIARAQALGAEEVVLSDPDFRAALAKLQPAG
ncbi:pyridoxal kinase [Sinirhodobacter populi]|uniref:pyridoxal kinase n=1 Tax=Paenirhodobacter populi TaxID=2306993 RepID=A0A443KQK0_9RHOB|nr:pyridoxal kinase [Sinirhodobacter populi]RWR35197.1 pyridoxal kinase [Sinirhodobacter populi]